MREYLFVIMVAAIVTYAGTTLMRVLATRFGAFTPVRDRDVHTEPTPRLGGVAMLMGFAAAVITASQLPFLHQVFRSGEIWGVLTGGALVCLVGAIDDVRELSPITKLAGQLLAAGYMARQGVQLLFLPLGDTVVLPGSVLVALTIFAVLASTNAVNFVDGLDGLAAGIVGIAASSFFIYAYLISRSYSPANVFTTAALISAAIVGCTLGFLPHNIHKARIFMGDSGALLLGLLLAAASITLTGTTYGADVSTNEVVATIMPLVVPVAILLLPFLDLVLAVIRRTLAGKRFWQPDAQHLHHRMLKLGHGHRKAVLLLWLWAFVGAYGSISFVFLRPQLAAVLVAVAVLIAATLTWWLPRTPIAQD